MGIDHVDVQEERRPLLIQTSAGAVQPFQGLRYDHRIHLIAFLHTSNVIRAAPIGIAVAFQIGELRALVQDARVAQMPLALQSRVIAGLTHHVSDCFETLVHGPLPCKVRVVDHSSVRDVRPCEHHRS